MLSEGELGSFLLQGTEAVGAEEGTISRETMEGFPEEVIFEL